MQMVGKYPKIDLIIFALRKELMSISIYRCEKQYHPLHFIIVKYNTGSNVKK